MLNSERKTFVVVGAGPKGLAIAVKAKVLEEFGFPVDKVILIERSRVAANWSGDFGYTNGEMKLGTSPEKDVVFPLETEIGDSQLNTAVRARLLQFTWVSFLVQTKKFSDWVDRGRPAPCHQLWSVYLRWISQQLAPQVKIISGEVTQVDLSKNEKSSNRSSWKILIRGAASPLYADRLMLTGPGKTKTNFEGLGQNELPEGVYDLESIWSLLKQKQFFPQKRIAIVGAGENSASVLLALAKLAPDLRVDVVSQKGFISTRAESYYENQVYSQPDRNCWKELSHKDRIDFIERTDLGVFSAHAMQILSDEVRHHIVPGRVVGLQRNEHGLLLAVEYSGRRVVREYDQIILATGSDYVSTLKSILSEDALRVLENSTGGTLTQQNLAEKIQTDLSVQGMIPSLHLPMLAGLMQGPGFSNLSCLGLLSDRVLIRDGAISSVKNIPMQKSFDYELREVAV